MKRYGYLYEKVFNRENITNAIYEAMRNHDKKRKDIKWVLRNIDYCVDYIMQNPHIVGKYIEHTIKDDSSGKVRTIKVPKFFPDQIIHHSIIRVINPIFQKSYYTWSCACIRKRGCLYASKHLRNVLSHDYKNTKYFVQIDISKYYDNVDKTILKQKLRTKIKDNKLLDLLDEIIDSVDFGIPIGNYTSQIFANVYLNDFDHYVKEKLRVKHYIRYADDIVILSGNKRELQKQIKSIKQFLENNKLKTHDDEIVKKTICIDFVGYRHKRTFTTIRRRIYKRLRRTLLRIKTNLCLPLVRRFISYFGYIKNSNSFNLRNKYFDFNIKKIKGVGNATFII